MPDKIQILDSKQAEVKLIRIAYEIVENNLDENEIVLAGIIDRGLDIATLLKQHIETISQLTVHLISIDINKLNPIEAKIVELFEPRDKVIIIVDDVANSGRTSLYATKLFLESLPKKIQIAVLVDRKHKQFPVSSDYIGLILSTTLQEHIHVEIKGGKVKSAYLE